MSAYMSPAPMGPSAVPFEMGHMQMYSPFMQGTVDFANILTQPMANITCLVGKIKFKLFISGSIG